MKNEFKTKKHQQHSQSTYKHFKTRLKETRMGSDKRYISRLLKATTPGPEGRGEEVEVAEAQKSQ